MMNAHTNTETGPALSIAEAKEIAECLHKAAYAQLSIHKLAMEVCDNGAFVQAGSIAIEELARSSMRRIDACIARIDPTYRLGNFGTEFEDARAF